MAIFYYAIKDKVNKIYKFVLLYPNKKYICRQMTLL